MRQCAAIQACYMLIKIAAAGTLPKSQIQSPGGSSCRPIGGVFSADRQKLNPVQCNCVSERTGGNGFYSIVFQNHQSADLSAFFLRENVTQGLQKTV